MTISALIVEDAFIPITSWPHALIIINIIGALSTLIAGFIVSSLRMMLLQIYNARQEVLVAERRQHEAEWAKQQARMEMQHLQQINTLKDQLLLNFNHEIRTPLTQIYGYIELIKTHGNTLEQEQLTSFLTHAQEGCDDLLQLINTILDTIEFEQEINTIPYKQFSVQQIVKDTLNDFNPHELETFTIHLDITDSATVWTNEPYFRQILTNLLSNACKYCPPLTLIRIEAIPTEITIDSTIVAATKICVVDQGPGIPLASQPLLFQKFVRLPRDLSGSIRGTGLGLYTSRRRVEIMHGKIGIESSGIEGEGSCFWFSLPANKPETVPHEVQ
jgi:signal transduction histidine kinase